MEERFIIQASDGRTMAGPLISREEAEAVLPFQQRIDPKARVVSTEWLARKADGRRAADLIDAILEPGATFRIGIYGGGRAYAATYRMNDEGLLDQVAHFEAPPVVNMEPEHLGFVVGYDAISEAVDNATCAGGHNPFHEYGGRCPSCAIDEEDNQ